MDRREANVRAHSLVMSSKETVKGHQLVSAVPLEQRYPQPLVSAVPPRERYPQLREIYPKSDDPYGITVFRKETTVMEPDVARLIITLFNALIECIAGRIDDDEPESIETAIRRSFTVDRPLTEFAMREELRRQAREQKIRPVFKRRQAVQEQMPTMMRELAERANQTFFMNDPEPIVIE